MTDTTLYFEDFHQGRQFVSAKRTVTAEEIVAFAKEFDPQPMHVDEAAGKASILGGLSASGWHTSSLSMRLFFETVIENSAGQGAPGVDFMEWRKPLLAGDTIQLTVTVLGSRPLGSRPGLGMVSFEQIITNQRGETIARMQAPVMFRMRDGKGA